MFLQNQNKKIVFKNNLSKHVFCFLFKKNVFKSLSNILTFIKHLKIVFCSLT